MQPIKVGSITKTSPIQHTDFSLRLTKINYACISELYIRTTVTIYYIYGLLISKITKERGTLGAMVASEWKIFCDSGPKDLTAVNW